MTVAYIALGSNLASPLEQVNAAVKAVGDIPDSRIVAVSSFYRTPPLGPQDQPDYLNAAVALETQLAPEELLNHTQRIELQQGRVRKAERWGPRTLDLDIMLFGDDVINTPRLTIPHYDMKIAVLCCGRSLKSPPTWCSRTASRCIITSRASQQKNLPTGKLPAPL